MNIKLQPDIEAVLEDIYSLYDSIVYRIDEFVKPWQDDVKILCARKFNNKYSYTATFTIKMAWRYVNCEPVITSILSSGDVNIYENKTIDNVFSATINFSEWK